MYKALPYIISFVGALGGSILLTPHVKNLSIHFGTIDVPDSRKVHKIPMPRWGGLAIASGVFLSALFSFFLFRQLQLYLDLRTQRYLLGLSIGGFLMMVLGMVDDRFNLPAKIKLLGQIVISIILIKFGIAITFLTIPGMGLVYLPPWLSWVVSLLWIVGITNAINLLDGLDGLLAGVSTIYALLFFAVAIIKGQFIVALIMMAIAGGCLGFLRYNYNPARIFMGDTGSLFLGVMFASLSIIGALKVTTSTAIFVPVLILGLPIFDTSFAILRRFIKGRPIFSPDKEHVHHQLLTLGLSVKQTVVLIYAICCTLGMLGLSISLMLP